MEKKNLEKESNKNEIALFKYAIIAPLVNDIYDSKSKEEFYRTAASKQYKLPNEKMTTLTAGTNNESIRTNRIEKAKINQ